MASCNYLYGLLKSGLSQLGGLPVGLRVTKCGFGRGMCGLDKAFSATNSKYCIAPDALWRVKWIMGWKSPGDGG